MTIVWLNPAALAALALVAGPVLVHLLLRHRASRIPFPSIRFVTPSRTAAVRVRLLSDLPLLLLRMALLAAVVVAVARPLLVWPWRLSAWNARIVRAIVIDDSESMNGAAAGEAAALAAREETGAVVSWRVKAGDLDAGLQQAAAMLATAPHARREIVAISDFQDGALTRRSVDALAPFAGLRLVQVGPDVPERELAGTELLGVEHGRRQQLTLTGTATGVSIRPERSEHAGLRFITDPADGAVLDSLIRAVASAGTPAGSGAQPIAIAFAGAASPASVQTLPPGWMLETVLRFRNDRDLRNAAAAQDRGSASGFHTQDAAWRVVIRDAQGRPVVRAAAAGPELVIDVAAPASSFMAAAAVRAISIARQGSPARPEEEVHRLTRRELDAWSRPAPPYAPDPRQGVEQTDSRWFWAGALLLLGVETLARRRSDVPVEEVHSDAA